MHKVYLQAHVYKHISNDLSVIVLINNMELHVSGQTFNKKYTDIHNKNSDALKNC